MRVVRPLVTAVVLVVLLSWGQRPMAGTKWDPIDPADLAPTAPVVEKDADAEVLLWSVRVTDRMVSARDSETVFEHDLRIKVFTDRGRRAQDRVDLPHPDWVRIDNVAARSIRRDGSFTELKKSDVFERTLAKAGGLKVKATSFALPPVDVGGVVEYRWRETHSDSIANNLRLPLSRDLPVRLVRYYLKPLRMAGLALQGQAFQTNSTLKMTNEDGFTVVSLQFVPARRDEPRAPTEWDTQPWMFIYYGRPQSGPSDAYWRPLAQDLASSADEQMSPTPEIERAVESLGIDRATDEEKIAALATFCRKHVRRVDVGTATEADRKAIRRGHSITDALAAGRGTAYDRLGLFVAMARAAGFDARLALLPSRNDVTIDRSVTLAQLMSGMVVAVRVGDGWRFVDPRGDHAPAGHIPWTAEMVPALIGDSTSPLWARTPPSPPEWSLRSRTARFRLSEDGTLEGDVATAFTGHAARSLRDTWGDQAPADYEAAIKDLVASRLPGAEISAVHFESAGDPEMPFADHLHLKVAGYAQRTGSRMFFQPAVLQKGIASEFPAASRRYPVSFDFAWKEVDRVRIDLPDGYQLEPVAAPAPASYPPHGSCTITLLPSADGRSVEMTREFVFGGGSLLRFPTEFYPLLKRFFDDVASLNGVTVTLKRTAATDAAR